ncbi:MAG: transcription elongation factor GreA [Burkholderiales bacterium]|nr:transcription elongation factor GreA [Burkholderiales bacterium]
MERYPMTVHGAKLLNEELERLKTVERPAIIQAIAEARSHGDLSENAEYHAAKERQAFIEGRIADIEGRLSLAQIIDPSKINNDGKIVFGAVVKLLDLETEKMVSYQIVGDDEADMKIAKISVNSPVARSLIGKEVGSIVEVRVPSGLREYEVIDFSF